MIALAIGGRIKPAGGLKAQFKEKTNTDLSVEENI